MPSSEELGHPPVTPPRTAGGWEKLVLCKQEAVAPPSKQEPLHLGDGRAGDLLCSTRKVPDDVVVFNTVR